MKKIDRSINGFVRAEYLFSGRIPSKKNSKRIIRVGRRSMLVSSKQHEIWEEQMLWELKNQDIPKEPFKGNGIHILLDFYTPDRGRADLTNKAESIMDVMIKAGIIEDDSWWIVNGIDLRFRGLDRKDPRCIVYLLIQE